LSGTLKRLLGHPLTRGRSLDDPELTSLRRAIVRGKPFLRAVYEDWYRWIAGGVPGGAGGVLELGSGGGFLADSIPGLITSEVFRCGGIRAVVDARRLPFRDGSLRAIVMTDVLHHVPDAGAFLGEATRVLRPGGALLMVEPWNTPLARLVWTHLHHEPFEPGAEGWSFPASGPLSGANTALPWMIFARDRDRFERTFPDLAVARIEPCMPFRYLLSGGVSLRSLQPGWTTRAWRAVEALFTPWMDQLGMFARVEVRRR
jgi:SAM-dependent methyltransferase